MFGLFFDEEFLETCVSLFRNLTLDCFGFRATLWSDFWKSKLFFDHNTDFILDKFLKGSLH